MNFVYLQKVLQLFGTEIRKNFIPDYKRRSISLARYLPHFVISDAISENIDPAKLISVFLEVFFGHIAPWATGLHVKEQLRLIH
jgi:membrane protein CcdC involved in cytochrome C biogenesis